GPGIQHCFFSSRSRHTRLVSDWSSDVCSSDLPIGYLRLIHPAGELAAARAAGAAGTAFVQSTISGHALEKTRAASTGPVGYQLYLVGGRAAGEAAIERARQAGFSALFVTIDTPVA